MVRMVLTRRRPAALLAALVVLATAACSSGSSSGPTAGASGQVRTVENIDGSPVQVPEHPTRIVTLSEPTTDGVLALGLTPVGIVAGRGQSGVSHYLEDRASGIPLLGGIAQPNYEAIGKAKPDLILVDGTSINNNDEAIAMLRRIAPTVYVGYAGGDWRTTFTNIAAAVDEADEGKAVLDAYDEHAATVRAQLAQAGLDKKTYSIVRWQGTSAALILQDLPPGQALIDLGLPRPAAQDRRGRGHAEPVSLENLSTIDADYVFFGTLGGSSVDNPAAGGESGTDGAATALAAAEQTPGFTDLTAYEDGHVIPVDGSTWTSTGGPILMTSIVDDVATALLGS